MAKEALNRHELPIQSILELGEDVMAIAPVHLSILGLPPEVRTDPHIVPSIRGAVQATFNEDMEYYLDVLNDCGGASEWSWLKGYERFSDDWSLEGVEEDGSGFLRLHWTEKEGTQSMGLVEMPVKLYNQWGEDGEFYSPESAMHGANGANIEIMYRRNFRPDVVWMEPDKMREYGQETARSNPQRGAIEVESRAFRSGLSGNMAKALLLRDFSVAYLNRLLETVNPNP
jgi:hypothetical protein